MLIQVSPFKSLNVVEARRSEKPVLKVFSLAAGVDPPMMDASCGSELIELSKITPS